MRVTFTSLAHSMSNLKMVVISVLPAEEMEAQTTQLISRGVGIGVVLVTPKQRERERAVASSGSLEHTELAAEVSYT